MINSACGGKFVVCVLARAYRAVEGGIPYWSGGLDFNGCLVLYYNACVHVPFMCMRLVMTDGVFSV